MTKQTPCLRSIKDTSTPGKYSYRPRARGTYLKPVSLYLLLLLTGLSFSSCLKEKEEPIIICPVVPAPTLKLSSSQIKEFKQINPDGSEQELPHSSLTEHFSKRPELFRPDSVKLENDSLHVFKPHGIKEAYKVKTEKNLLYIFNTSLNTWAPVGGLLAGASGIQLHISWYKKTTTSATGVLNVYGQEYSLDSYKDLIVPQEKDHTSITWLKQQFNYTLRHRQDQ